MHHRVGPTPTTDRISILRYGDEPQRMDSGGEVDTVFYPSPLLKKVSFVDTPGLESIFQKHEETTRRFLHRSDVVMMVMLATQAMSQRNLDYLQQLREYGKKVIILVNQADLLSEAERETVREYVLEQSRARLGVAPEIWMVSARLGLAASGQVPAAPIETDHTREPVVEEPARETISTDATLQAMPDADTEPVNALETIGAEDDEAAEGDAEAVNTSAAAAQQDLTPEPMPEARPEPVLSRGEGTNGTEKRIDTLWKQSGLGKIERYIDEQLGDADRLRLKLQTPLQIIQNVHRVALEAVKANQSVLDQYQGIAENVQGQLNSYRRESERMVREANEDIRGQFKTAAERGSDAIKDVFQLSRAFSSVGRGLLDLIGIARLFRRPNQPGIARVAFERHDVYEPLDKLSEIVNKLGPRLEGKDLQDTDDLVKYGQKEVSTLPENIRDKVIGTIQPPMTYDRSAMNAVRPELEDIEERARKDETENLEQNLRSVFFGLAVWELLIVVIAIVIALAAEFTVAIVVVLLVAAALGLLMTPVAGRVLASRYTNRLLTLQEAYIDVLSKATDTQVDYGMRLRRDVVAPLTRLVETQTDIQTQQMNQLQSLSQNMIEIESELSKLGKRRLFG